jgi:hypothetical protein
MSRSRFEDDDPLESRRGLRPRSRTAVRQALREEVEEVLRERGQRYAHLDDREDHRPDLADSSKDMAK